MGSIAERLKIEDSQRAQVRQNVISGSAFSGAFLTLNAAATIIAGLGMLENSPSVVIGAMLIAMLFGPILGIALGLAEADMGLLGRSLMAEIGGAAWVLAIAYIIGLCSRDISIGSEILSRTSPSVIDLLVALVGGLAAGFTFAMPRLAGIMVGVALATALVPPLTCCGILLARNLPELAGGAFLLFLANLVAIAFGAMVVFLAAGFRPEQRYGRALVIGPRLISVALLIVLAVHLTLTLRSTVRESLLLTGIRRALSEETQKIPGARLVTLNLTNHHGGTVAWAVVRAPQPVSPDRVAVLNRVINRAAGRDVMLHVRSVLTAEATRDGYVFRPDIGLDEQVAER